MNKTGNGHGVQRLLTRNLRLPPKPGSEQQQTLVRGLPPGVRETRPDPAQSSRRGSERVHAHHRPGLRNQTCREQGHLPDLPEHPLLQGQIPFPEQHVDRFQATHQRLEGRSGLLL